MSDYTPDGISDSEPSMEDILASIRKIIADDSSKPKAPAPAAETVSLSSPDHTISEFDNVLDLSDDRFAEFVSEDIAPADEDADGEDVLDLTESLLLEDENLSLDGEADFDLVLDDEDTQEAVSLKAGAAVAAGAVAAKLVTSDTDATDDIINEIEGLSDADFDVTEFDLDIPPEAEQVIDPAADMLSDDDAVDDLMSDLLSEDDEDDAQLSADVVDENASVAGIADESAELSTAGDADIDLVKSLMAELTEDDEAFDDLSSGEITELGDEDFEFEALIDTSDEDATPSDMTGIAAAAVEQPHDDIDDDLASIVAQSSADIEAAKSDAQALQQDDSAFDIAALIEDGESETVDETDSSGPGIIGAAIAGASVAGVSAAVLKSDDVATDDSVAADDDAGEAEETANALDAIEDATESAHDFGDIETDIAELAAEDLTPKEDTDMPRIVKSDTLATDETVEATSDAFASLSQVVEEKAVYNESGPRIGDLVQEALKPMLQEWLDKNLKGIVDRAVAKEIKRISSGK